MATVSFNPKKVTKKILSPLQDRAYDVIASRFGLHDDAEQKTLEAIGQKYGITRERVRQIENAAISTIKKSSEFKEGESVFAELKALIESMGGIVSEEDVLNTISKDEVIKNHVRLYMVLSDYFTHHKEDDHFKHRWSVDPAVTDKVHGALKSLFSNLSDEELFSEKDLVDKFMVHIKGVSDKYFNSEVAKRWLNISKGIGRNPLGDWGKTTSTNVKTRGVRDLAYLMLRKHGAPMHFREVADSVCKTFGKEVHPATCHNELIKDPRFVLVGRGMYALASWGYKTGVVRDVIKEILKKEGPMSKEDIVDRVMKERFLKKNTIIVNLQDSKYFKKNKNGLYTIA